MCGQEKSATLSLSLGVPLAAERPSKGCTGQGSLPPYPASAMLLSTGEFKSAIYIVSFGQNGLSLEIALL